MKTKHLLVITYVVAPINAVEGRVGLDATLEVSVVAFLDEVGFHGTTQGQTNDGGICGDKKKKVSEKKNKFMLHL